MNVGRTWRRAAAFVVHNWPLKAAAILVATLLYAGLVVSQDSDVYPGPISVTPVNQPGGTIRINELRDVEDVRYIAPADAGRLTADDFRATVDLADVKPTGEPTSVRVDVVAIDPRVTILEYRPRTVQVILDESVRKRVPVRLDMGPVPERLDVGEATTDPEVVTVSGPSTKVRQVVAARVRVTFDPAGIDVDNDMEPEPVDAAGEVVVGVDVDPQAVHLTIPVFTDRESRTLPVNPIVSGTPAPGFRIAGIELVPLVVSVEGDGERLAELVRVDTEPVPVFSATSDVEATVNLALPDGVAALGPATIRVTVRVEPVTETRTYASGIRLDGTRPGLEYAVAPDSVLLTLFGSVVDLDRLAAAPIVVGLNVADLEPGVHDVPVVPSLPAGVTLAAISPETVAVTITQPATPAPEATPSPSSSVAPSPTAAP
jgi:YbbR domain-containing protein